MNKLDQMLFSASQDAPSTIIPDMESPKNSYFIQNGLVIGTRDESSGMRIVEEEKVNEGTIECLVNN